MAALDMSRLSQGVNLPPEVSGEIIARARKTNPFAQLAKPMQMPGVGKSFTIITSEPKARWVAETARKPVSSATVSSKVIHPYKVAVIQPYSKEFVRDADTLYNELVTRLPDSLTERIVETISGLDDAPATDFTQLSNAAPVTFDQANAFKSMLDVERAVTVAGDGVVTGYALNPLGRIALMSATDTTGRPLLLNDISAGPGALSVLGAPAAVSKDVGGPAGTLGFAGDWNYARYGTVENVQISVSDQASYTGPDGVMVSAYESNMVLVRAEVEVAFDADLTKFVRLVDKAPAGK